MSKLLIALVVIALVAGLVIFVVLVVLLASIRREDRAPELAARPPTVIAAFTRHLAGLHVRRLPAAESAGAARPGSCPGCGTSRTGDGA